LNQSTGVVSGTPQLKGSYDFTLQVLDAQNGAVSQPFTIQVNAQTLTISPANIPNATSNVPYSFALGVTGGKAPYTWSLSAGGLLTGFAIDLNTGLLSGTPTQAGTYTFTISVVDSTYDLGLQTYQFTVQTNGLSITNPTPPAATVGVAYDFALLSANGAVPLTWSVVSGTPPPGIGLDPASGQLNGTPTAAGSYTFTVQVQDSTSATAQARVTLVVNPVPLTITTTSLPSGTVGTAYSQTLKASGGQGAIAWLVTSGAPPAGLQLSSAGVISGTPTAVGSSSFTVQAKDSVGTTATQNLSIAIELPATPPTVTLTGLPATSNPGDQPTVTISLASGYPLPILVTATLSITPKPAGTTDLMFSNGSTSIQLTIPANSTQATLPIQVGTFPGTIQLSLDLSAAGIDITPAVVPTATTKIAASAPVIKSVTVTTTSSGLQVNVVGLSTTLDMKTAAFHFTAAAGSTLTTTDLSVDVSAAFAAWYASPASLATGSQFSFTIPFTVNGSASTIASVSVTMTNSVGSSAPVSAIVP
jgi:hypothetical protein